MNGVRKAGNVSFLAGILLLPFTWDLVLDVGIPLKAYEILFGFALVCFMLVGRERSGPGRLRPVRTLGMFLGAVLVSAAAGLLVIRNVPVPVWAVGRDHPYRSILFEYLYLLFDAGVLFLTVAYIRDAKRLRTVLNLLAAGSVVASLYGIAQLVVNHAAGTVPQLPTMPGRRALVDFIIPRITGSFKEPNYLAGFLVCVMPYSLVRLFGPARYVRRFGAVLAVQLAGLYLTFSTVGWLVFAAAGSGLLAYGYRINRKRTLLVAGALAAVILALVVVNPRIFYEVIVDKLFGRFVNPNTISRIERQMQIKNALLLFLRYPFFGVGLSNYGLVADHAFGLNAGFNITVNSVPAEILCETGMVGFTAASAFVWHVFRPVLAVMRSDPSRGMDGAGVGWMLISLVVMLNAYPSHSLTFIWVLFGLGCAVPGLCYFKYNTDFCKSVKK